MCASKDTGGGGARSDRAEHKDAKGGASGENAKAASGCTPTLESERRVAEAAPKRPRRHIHTTHCKQRRRRRKQGPKGRWQWRQGKLTNEALLAGWRKAEHAESPQQTQSLRQSNRAAQQRGRTAKGVWYTKGEFVYPGAEACTDFKRVVLTPQHARSWKAQTEAQTSSTRRVSWRFQSSKGVSFMPAHITFHPVLCLRALFPLRRISPKQKWKPCACSQLTLGLVSSAASNIFVS